MFASDGTLDGGIAWCRPWRARNAKRLPEAERPIVIGDDGNPHGCQQKTHSLGVDLVDDLNVVQLVETRAADNTDADRLASPFFRSSHYGSVETRACQHALNCVRIVIHHTA